VTNPARPTVSNTTEPDAAAVRTQIRAAIIEGEYAPRQRLIESDLCDRFGGTRFVVRVALQELAAHGLVEFQRNRGARVRDVSIAEAIEITEVREMLEGFVAARAAERVTTEQAAALRQLAVDMRAAVAAGELMRYGELNAKLHSGLRDIAAHRISSRTLEQLRDLTVRHDFKLSLTPGRPLVSLPQHEAIVDAVIAKDPAAAERTMREHLRSVVDALNAFGSGSQAT
jgi:DNA-binding GntR family transcriptional regulator